MPTSFMAYSTVLSLRTLGNFGAPVCVVTGYNVAGDGGGGQFFWDEQSTAPDDGGTILGSSPKGRWRRIRGAGTHVDARWFGAVGDGLTDDTAALQRAINFAVAEKSRLSIPRGNYLISSTLVISGNLILQGDGQYSTCLVAPTGSDVVIMEIACAGVGLFVDIGFLMFKGGAYQLKLSGQNTGFLYRDSSLHDLSFLLYKNAGLWIDTAMNSTLNRNLNFEGGGAGPANAGIYSRGATYLHYSCWDSVRSTTNTEAGVHIEDTVVGNNGAGTVGVVFRQLTLENNQGSGLYLKSSGVVLYNPYFERNGTVSGNDVTLDTNYSVGSATVTAAYIKLVSPTFDVPAAQTADGAGYTRIKLVNRFATIVVEDAHLAAGYQQQIDTASVNNAVSLTRSAFQIINPL